MRGLMRRATWYRGKAPPGDTCKGKQPRPRTIPVAAGAGRVRQTWPAGAVWISRLQGGAEAKDKWLQICTGPLWNDDLPGGSGHILPRSA